MTELWYPGAEKMVLLPESNEQQTIRPTQLIFHSIIANWTARRTYEYWRDSTNLESHFGLGYAGDLAQYIPANVRADANYHANRRADGTGALSMETASNSTGTDPWTPEQLDKMIDVGAWAHKEHGIPLRICTTPDGPGFGYHKLHEAEWAISGTSCPGPARIKQFREIVFPGIVARVNGTNQEEDDMTPEQAKFLTDTFAAVRQIEAALKIAPWTYKGTGVEKDAYWHLLDTKANAFTVREEHRATAKKVDLVTKKVDAIAKEVTAIKVGGIDLDALAAKVADLLAARLAK